MVNEVMGVAEQIKVYLNEPQTDYVIMFEGGWGSGKTYFLKNRLLKELDGDTNIAVIYISLFGLESIVEVYEAIAINVLNIKANQDAIKKVEMQDPSNKDKSKTIFSSLSQGSYTISKVINQVSNLIPTVKEIKRIATVVSSNIIDYSKYLFIFDDFERTMVSKKSLLGCFDNLVEQYHAKVIVVCYEMGMKIPNRLWLENHQLSDKSAISNVAYNHAAPDSFDDSMFYTVYKEKVFGLTIRYECNLKDVFDELVSELVKEPEALQILKQEKDNILKLFQLVQSSNIRTLKFILKRYVELYVIINKQFPGEVDLFYSFMHLVLNNITATSLRVKEMGEQNVYEGESIETYIDVTQRSNEKKEFSLGHLDNYVKVHKAIDEYIQTFHIDQELLTNHIKKLIYDDEHNINKIKNKVSSAFDKNEIEAREILQSIKQDIYNNKVDINAYSRIIDSVFLLNDILEENRDIETLKIAILRNAELRYGEFQSLNWDFFESVNEEVKCFKNQLYDLLNQKIIEDSVKKLENVFNSDERFMEKVSEYMNDHYIISRSNKAIFYKVAPAKFVERIIGLQRNTAIIKFRNILRSTYLNTANIKELYKNDCFFFRDVNVLLKRKLEEDKHVMDRLLHYHLILLNRCIESIVKSLS